MKSFLLSTVVALGIAASSQALAAVTPVAMYNTVAGDTFSGAFNYAVSQANQGWAEMFNSGLATTLTDVFAYVTQTADNGASVYLKILSDGGSGIPGGTVLWDSGSMLGAPTGISVSGLSTPLEINTNYWLAVLPANEFQALWVQGDTGTSGTIASYSIGGEAWTAFTIDPFAGGAIVNGSYTTNDEPPPSGVPEPATLALLGGALVGLGALRRRKAA